MPGGFRATVADCVARGADVDALVCDIRDTRALAAALHARDAAHPVDLVIANAGVEASIGADGAPEPLDAVLAQVETNLAGALASVVPLLPAMQARRRGGVILVSSLAALEPLADQPTYCATKAGLLAWGEAARPWLRRFGITVTVACPGFIATGMSARYEGWRPLEWSADKAARHIARAAARGPGPGGLPLAAGGADRPRQAGAAPGARGGPRPAVPAEHPLRPAARHRGFARRAIWSRLSPARSGRWGRERS